MIGRFLGRFPRIIASIILGALAVSAWQATVYVDTVVRPREAAARQAMIEREIGRADTLFSRAKFETALNEYDYVLAGYPDELPAVRTAVKSCWPMACLYRSLRFGEEYLPVSALLVDKT